MSQAAALAASVSLIAALAWASAKPVHAVWAGTATFDLWLGAAAAAFAWLIAAWLALSVLTALAISIPGRLGQLAAVVATRVAPAVLLRILTVGVGISTLTAPVTLAGAYATGEITGHPHNGTVASAGTADSAALPEIGRPAVAAPATAGLGMSLRPPSTATHPRPAAESSVVTVRHGDTLWDIAARHLGPGCTTAQIADAWPRWFAKNRDTIGADPDAIHPGMRLYAPDDQKGCR